jgi:hypothetical protein
MSGTMQISDNLLKALPEVSNSPFAYSVIIVFIISSIYASYIVRKKINIKNSTIVIFTFSIIAVAAMPFVYGYVSGSLKARAVSSSMEAKYVSLSKQIDEITEYYMQQINSERAKNQKELNYLYTSFLSFRDEIDKHYNAQQRALDENNLSSFYEHEVQIQMTVQRYNSLIAVAKQQEQKSKSTKDDMPRKIEDMFNSVRVLGQFDPDNLPDPKNADGKSGQNSKIKDELSPEKTDEITPDDKGR